MPEDQQVNRLSSLLSSCTGGTDGCILKNLSANNSPKPETHTQLCSSQLDKITLQNNRPAPPLSAHNPLPIPIPLSSYLFRQLSRRSKLYTEMYVDKTLLHQKDNLWNFLGHRAADGPLAVQVRRQQCLVGMESRLYAVFIHTRGYRKVYRIRTAVLSFVFHLFFQKCSMRFRTGMRVSYG